MAAPPSLAQLISTLPDHVAYNPERARIAAASAKISQRAAEILAGCCAAVALLAVCGRVLFQLKKRGKLFADDFLVIFATCCLATSTGLFYKLSPSLFMTDALRANRENLAMYSSKEATAMLAMHEYIEAFITFAWTANYAVKLSFLVFFRQLVRDVSGRLTIMWWFVLAFTIVSWIFSILNKYIACSVSGTRCSAYPKMTNVLMPTGWTCFALDVASDVGIVLIPILLLRNSFLRLSQKLRILAFLCLNVFCIALALSRIVASAYHADGQIVFRIVHTHFLLHIQACVAVLMGGVTAFRTIFASHFRERENQRSAFHNRMRSWFKRPESSPNEALGENEKQRKGRFLPVSISRGTIRGLRTFIRRNGREKGHTTCESTENGSQDGSLQSYHNYMKGEIRRIDPEPESTGKIVILEQPPSPALYGHDFA
ncbi:unnamed protein product [Periconia digitata]|uniref:Rhodopsin domain-containing protein n=1 Tax=Periconia digitata TaxID=1303443 RepID=A0A9W4UHM0_9PLEO|nr:unnamed protein product [Periconia digitata]